MTLVAQLRYRSESSTGHIAATQTPHNRNILSITIFHHLSPTFLLHFSYISFTFLLLLAYFRPTFDLH